MEASFARPPGRGVRAYVGCAFYCETNFRMLPL